MRASATDQIYLRRILSHLDISEASTKRGKQPKRGKKKGQYFQRDEHGIRRRICWGLSFRIPALQHITQWIPFSLATQTIPVQIRAMGSSHFCLGQKVNIFLLFWGGEGNCNIPVLASSMYTSCIEKQPRDKWRIWEDKLV